MNTGVGAQCTACGRQWYDEGVCQGCRSDADIEFTWIDNPRKGGVPSSAPSDTFQLKAGACAQLIDSWTSLVMVRGVTPLLTSAGPGAVSISSPPWYVERGVKWSARLAEPTDPNFAEKFRRASDWTNQSFIIRVVVTFESFGSGLKGWRFPKAPGMREFHYTRRLRNAIAHGNGPTDLKLVNEETKLFRTGKPAASTWSVAIDEVLEPLWARLLIYARSLEQGAAPIPSDPAVVVASVGNTLTIQSFQGKLEVKDHNSGTRRSIGEIVSLKYFSTI